MERKRLLGLCTIVILCDILVFSNLYLWITTQHAKDTIYIPWYLSTMHKTKGFCFYKQKLWSEPQVWVLLDVTVVKHFQPVRSFLLLLCGCALCNAIDLQRLLLCNGAPALSAVTFSCGTCVVFTFLVVICFAILLLCVFCFSFLRWYSTTFLLRCVISLSTCAIGTVK